MIQDLASSGASSSRPLGPRRRTVVLGAATAAALTPLAGLSTAPAAEAAAGPAFLHGVAAGDPLPDGVLLWTRVTPDPGAVPGSGRGSAVTVGWEVSADRGFSQIVAAGTTTASAATDHTVKVDVRGLRPRTPYWYRFTAGTAISPVGRALTTAAADTATDRVRFGVVSCANWESGYFSAYRHLAGRADLDAILHLGDYIYEYGTGEYPEAQSVVRQHEPKHEIVSLADYRARHGKYKTDADLQALHAAHPIVAIWDDHEFADDAWAGGAGNHTPGTEGDWAARAAAAKQAYFEWMPVRPSIAGTVYRRLSFGSLADLHLLDLRSFRSQQAKTGSSAVDDPTRSITGRAQLDWLKSGLVSSNATWKLVGTSVMISPVAFGSLPARLLKPLRKLLGLPAGGIAVNVDQWDGYTSDRKELLQHLRDRGVKNTVFLTGDIHMAWANDVPMDMATYPASGTAATEFVVTSVTSDNLDEMLGVPADTVSLAAESAVRAANWHVKAVDMDAHGYGVLDVTAQRTQMDYYVLSDMRRPDATAAWSHSFRTLNGTQKLEPAEQPVL
ncbi:alkaline phosphatase D family protein [Streptomyces sp. NBC_01264]|uniref:alkaline phosphatase D family protein n=1 Tax=Streptomyces sp. NBC_01264 TaxID=2903804 RepID=UPI002255771C|nr:alkaline phosphatase D family protein [Streptomyces sp. NBC_01264]MCX4775369.1 alkaline phosphatase D family protein [Streptomyces sp. NBC_01264]